VHASLLKATFLSTFNDAPEVDAETVGLSLIGAATRLFGTQSCCFWPYDPLRHQLLAPIGSSQPTKFSETVIRELLSSTEPFKIGRDHAGEPRTGSDSSIAVPFNWRGQRYGILCVSDDSTDRVFSDIDATLLADMVQDAEAALLLRLDREYHLLFMTATKAIVEADLPQAGIPLVASILQSRAAYSFCQVLIRCEHTNELIVKAATSTEDFLWNSRLGERFTLGESSGSFNFLQADCMLHEGDPSFRDTLKDLSTFLASPPVASVICIPVEANGRNRGAVLLGSTACGSKWLIERELIHLARAIAQHLGVWVEKLAILDTDREYRRLLNQLDEYSRDLLLYKDPPQLELSIARLAAQLLDCNVGCVFQNQPATERLMLSHVYGFPMPERPLVYTHGTGVVGKAAIEDRAFTCAAPTVQDHELLTALGTLRVIAAPMRYGGQLLGVVVVGDSARQAFTAPMCDVLYRFAKRSAIALGSSGNMSPEHRTTKYLMVIHTIRDYIQNTDRDLNCILHVIVAAITANYGLAFNRAALFLADGNKTALQGIIGIGQTTEASARKAWEEDRSLRLDDPARHIKLIESGRAPVTEVGEQIVKMRLSPSERDPIWRAFVTGTVHKCSGEDLKNLPDGIQRLLRPTKCVYLVPLIANNEQLGVLLADREFIEDVDEADEKALLGFCGIAATAIETKRLRTFRSLYVAGRNLMAESDPEKAIKLVVDRLPENTGADEATVLFGLENPLKKPTCLRAGSAFSSDLSGKTLEVSRQVLRSGKWINLENAAKTNGNAASDIQIAPYTASACFPITVAGKPIGVLWLHYRQIHQFSLEEVDMITMHTDNVGIAYSNAFRLRRLQSLQQEAAKVSGPLDLSEVREEIVSAALRLFSADVAVLWPYHAERHTYVAARLASQGLTLDQEHYLSAYPPRLDGSAYGPAENWSYYPDISSLCPRYMDPEAHSFLVASGVLSLQTGTLRSGDELLGVLELYYKHSRIFTEEDRATGLTFCDSSGLALKKATLFEQLRSFTEAAQDVARKVVSEDLDSTLTAVARGIKSALACDAVVLYSYDPESQTIGYPPAHVGVRSPELIQRYPQLPHDSVVYKFLAMDKLCPISRVEDDVLLSKADFRKREDIVSCIVAPLRAADERVGLVFVNYRHFREFHSEELFKVEFFSKLAALAIHDAALLRTRTQKLKEQTHIAKLAHSLLEVLDLRDILDCCVKFAKEILQTEFSHIVLDEPSGLVVAAVEGWDKGLIGTLQLKPGKGSHAGYTILRRAPVAVEDLEKESPHFEVHDLSKRQRIRSGLGVPIFQQQRIIGALLVQSRLPRKFREDEERMLQLIADQTAIAIKAGLQYQVLERRNRQLEALFEAAKILVRERTLNQDQILGKILEVALRGVTRGQYHNGVVGTLHLYDAKTDEARIAAIQTIPPELVSELQVRIGAVRSIRAAEARGEKIGTTGRVIVDGKPILLKNVNDANAERDFIRIWGQTRSEIAVPISNPTVTSHNESRILGAIGLETDILAAFDDEDVKNLETMARFAEALIEKANLDAKSRSLNRELQDLDRRKTQWIRFVSHELRTPLQPLEALLKEQLDTHFGYVSPRLRERLEVNLDMIRQQAGMIENLLVRARIEAQEDMPLVLVKSNMAQVLDSVYRSFKPSADRKKITLVLRPMDQPKLSLEMDDKKISHVVSNLVSNALKFTPTGGKIEMSAEKEDNQIIVRVRDTGRGIPPEAHSKIFGLHSQAMPSDARQGFGLGLHIVKHFVTIHKGEVSFQSRQGTGTEFWFSLPIKQPQ
jgi:GAF domain-containing protein/anti-sigma regulatory factor (Ser/Thr protein kinase)